MARQSAFEINRPLRVPCPCFPLINHYFYKKLNLCIQIPNIYLRLGVEFSHCVSVARAQFYSALFGSLSIKSYAWFFFFCYAEPLPTDLSAQ